MLKVSRALIKPASKNANALTGAILYKRSVLASQARPGAVQVFTLLLLI
jgi:hypothetical protein